MRRLSSTSFNVKSEAELKLLNKFYEQIFINVAFLKNTSLSAHNHVSLYPLSLTISLKSVFFQRSMATRIRLNFTYVTIVCPNKLIVILRIGKSELKDFIIETKYNDTFQVCKYTKGNGDYHAFARQYGYQRNLAMEKVFIHACMAWVHDQQIIIVQ